MVEGSQRGLELVDVTVAFPGKPPTTVLEEVSFSVARAATLAVLGPSGSGKSTLLAAIAGVIPVSSGMISFAGEDVSQTPVHRRGFGLVFQDAQLFPHLDVRGNVAFGLQMERRPKQEVATRVNELLAMSGIDHLASRSVGDLSGGERQRVALARALAPHPRLVLLDEPLSALDADLRNRLAADIRTMLDATGTTAILVTHDRNEARALASESIELSEGHLRL